MIDEIKKLVPDKTGKLVPIYLPGQKTLELQKKNRLGIFYGVETISHELGEVLTSSLLICQTSQELAKRLVATRLSHDKRNFKYLQGNDLQNDRFKEDSDESLRGYSAFPQLFLFFGYTEFSGKQYVPKLITEVFSLRHMAGLHCWFFSPMSLEALAERYELDTFINLRRLHDPTPLILRFEMPASMQAPPTPTKVIVLSSSSESITTKTESPIPIKISNSMERITSPPSSGMTKKLFPKKGDKKR